jgi:hypothetical protein
MMADSSPPAGPSRKENVKAPRQGWALTALGVPAAFAVGLVLRSAFLPGKTFWRDEAWVAWVVGLPAEARAGVQHVAPLGFLAAVRAFAALVPSLRPEVAYRMVPLAAGVASMVLLPVLARRLRAGQPAVASTAWLAAGMPALVYYSRELKPYSLDLLWATLLLLLALQVTQGPADGRATWGRWLALAGLSAAGPWISYGAPFPTAAALGWIAWRTMRTGGRRGAAAAVVTTAIFAVGVAAAYVVYLRGQVAHPLLPLMWDDALRETGLPFTLAVAARSGDAVRQSLVYLFPTVWPAAAALALIGVSALPPGGRGALLWCWAAAAVLAGGCAAARLYVVSHGRFLLFLAPPLVVSVTAGLARCCDLALRRFGPRATAVAAIALSAACALSWGAQSLRRRLPPDTGRPRPFVFDVMQDVPALVDWLDARRVPPSALLIGRYAADPFRFYSRGRLEGARLMGFRGHGYGAEFGEWLEGRSQGWMLLVDEEAGSYRRTLAAASFRIETVASARGAVVWRVTREASPPRTPPDIRAGGGAPTGPRG